MPLGQFWGLFCREQLYESLYDVPRRPGSPSDGIFFLPPPILELCFDEGIWDDINEETGLLFDLAEEEEIKPDHSMIIASKLRFLASKFIGLDSMLTRVVGQMDGKDIEVNISAKDFSEWLIRLALFLEKEAAQKNTICAIF